MKAIIAVLLSLSLASPVFAHGKRPPEEPKHDTVPHKKKKGIDISIPLVIIAGGVACFLWCKDKDEGLPKTSSEDDYVAPRTQNNNNLYMMESK